jgi:serine/threonine protein kinase
VEVVQIDREQWPALSRLLDEALEVPLESRERWLESLAAADAIHRAKLRELLNQHAAAQTGEFLYTLPKLGDESAAAQARGGLAPGTVIGPYIIEQEIGRGGMGAVWKARRSDGVIKRPVALKLPHAGPHSQELIERFTRERDILAELSHPNIARLDDAGLTSSGQPYLALEYVPGVRLTEYCDDLRLDVRSRLQLCQQVLRAVQHAHGHLVIHRDLKPSNILVTPDGQAMLLDFGIAKLIPADSLAEADRTQWGGVALTPEYASPEQIAGKPVSIASDIYSLGVLLFELLTGERPYRLKRNTRAALEDAIIAGEPQRPSSAVQGSPFAAARGTTVKNLARTLRGDLDTIVLKALKKSPAERYATADALSQDIERYLSGQPVSARADGSWYRARKFVGRHKWPVAAASAAAVALIATAAIALFEAHEAKAERDRALALSARNEAVTEFVNTLVTDAGGSDEPVTVGEMLARSESLISAEYEQNPDHRAAILGMLGIYYHTIGQDKRSEPLLNDALQAVRASTDGDLRRQLTCQHAMSLGGLGKVKEATEALDSVIADSHTTLKQQVECLEYLAYIAQDGDDPKGALKYGTLALQRLHSMPNPSLTTEAVLLGSVGFAQQLNNQNDAAEKSYRQSLAQFAKAGRDSSPDAIAVRNNWAMVSLGAGEPKRALGLYDQTLEIVSRKDPGAQPPLYLLGNHARALESAGKFPQARDEYSKCVALTTDATMVVQRTFCLMGLASVEFQVGHLAAAGEYVSKAATSIPESVPRDFPARTAVQVMRARIEVAERQFAAARPDLDVVISTAKSDSALMQASFARGELNLADNQLPAALQDARRGGGGARAAQGGVPY